MLAVEWKGLSKRYWICSLDHFDVILCTDFVRAVVDGRWKYQMVECCARFVIRFEEGHSHDLINVLRRNSLNL